MRKRIAIAAALACAFSLTVAQVGTAAAPPSDTETVAAETEAAEELEDAGNGHTEDGTTDPTEGDEGENAEGMEDGENTDEAGTDAADEDSEEPETSEADVNADASGAAAETKAANSVALPSHATDPLTATAEETGSETHSGDEEASEDEYEAIPDVQTYSAPADEQHVNVSFDFNETGSSSYFTELTYPLTLSLKEVDTGRKLTLTIKSEYPVRFAANNGLKMFMNFIADNIFLVLFFVFAALFYKAVVIPRFASDVRRR